MFPSFSRQWFWYFFYDIAIHFREFSKKFQKSECQQNMEIAVLGFKVFQSKYVNVSVLLSYITI